MAQAPPYVHKPREVQAPPPPTDPEFAPPSPPTQPPLGPTALPPPPPTRRQKGQGVSPGLKAPHEVLHPQHGPQIWRLELDCEWCNACFTTPWAGGGTPTEKVKAEGWCKIGTSWHRHQCQQCKAQGLQQRVDGRDARLHRAERRELRAANRLKPAGTGSSSSTARAGTGASSSTAGVTELAFLVPPAPATEQVQQEKPNGVEQTAAASLRGREPSRANSKELVHAAKVSSSAGGTPRVWLACERQNEGSQQHPNKIKEQQFLLSHLFKSIHSDYITSASIQKQFFLPHLAKSI